jgi:K(+)-stimulated pyrophosphate-energized sodium pump
MRIAVLANTRTTQAATQSRSAAMRVAFNGVPSPDFWLSAWLCSPLASFYPGQTLDVARPAVKSLVGLALVRV